MTRSDKTTLDQTPEPASATARRERALDKSSLGSLSRRMVSRTRWLRAVQRIRELSTTVNTLRQENATLRRMAYHDSLTGLLNRRGFDEQAGPALAELDGGRGPLALILLDVDDLKHINDSAGHATGDSALRIVAEALRGAVRVGDLVTRLGGDEFAVLLPRTDEAHAQRIAERVRATLQQAGSVAGHAVTVSAGVAELRAGDATADRAALLLARADRALYAAKRAGRNRVGSATCCACTR